ncbi:hypothetical protein HZH68_004967 [Vespula germanica]|uniref:Uncharacterized protein n=1 Tax=Vespula germanica TaxID=30212 RepID=A0A834KF53_VESGE|nr:hypothetical protein HZH68_004967 [Vespula germanica]
MKDVSGEIALVTDAGGGLGRSLALGLANLGVIITILINNAGVINIRKFWETPYNLLTHTMNVNIMSHFWTVKAFLPGIIESNKGHIVSIASVAGHIGFPKAVEYCTSKYAVVGFNEALQMELMFLSTLSPKEVAEKTITSLRCNKKLILIPAYFQFLLLFKWILPWFFICIVLCCLIRDVSPTYEPIEKSSINGIKTNITMKIQDDGAKHQ